MRSAPAAAVAVIPACNEASTIRDVVQRTLAQLPEVIVVDDGSTDGTAGALEGLPVIVLRNETNSGKAASLHRGAREAIARGARAIVTLDGDGQHCPEDIPLLLEAFRSAPGCIIIGSRLHHRDSIPAPRYWANRIANFWISRAAGCKISDSQSGFRVYPAALFGRAQVRHDRAASFVFESEILIEAARLGAAPICVPVRVVYHARMRPSHFRAVVDIARIVRMVARRLLTGKRR
jgi:glycosyltransferase involved in cell wall biosynthesis